MAGNGDADPMRTESEKKSERERQLLKARGAHDIGNFEKAIEFMKDVAKLGKELGIKLEKNDRKVFAEAYKKYINQKRRALAKARQSEKCKNSYLNDVENELRDECLKADELLDILYSNSIDGEDEAFYLKMKADFKRYLLNANSDNMNTLVTKCLDTNVSAMMPSCKFLEFFPLIKECTEIYKKAQQKADKLPKIHPTRLGVFLNFAIFMDENNERKKGVDIARQALDGLEEELKKKRSSLKDEHQCLKNKQQLLKDEFELLAESELLQQHLENFLSTDSS